MTSVVRNFTYFGLDRKFLSSCATLTLTCNVFHYVALHHFQKLQFCQQITIHLLCSVYTTDHFASMFGKFFTNIPDCIVQLLIFIGMSCTSDLYQYGRRRIDFQIVGPFLIMFAVYHISSPWFIEILVCLWLFCLLCTWNMLSLQFIVSLFYWEYITFVVFHKIFKMIFGIGGF